MQHKEIVKLRNRNAELKQFLSEKDLATYLVEPLLVSIYGILKMCYL